MQIKGPHVGGGRRLRIAVSVGLTGLLLAVTPGLDATSVAADGGAPVEGASGALDEAAASAKAARTGEEVEADELATPTTRVVALPEGGFRAEVSALPSRVQDGDGEWQPVDNTLIRNADGEIAPKRAAAPMSFSVGGEDALARIEDDGRSLAVAWPAGGLPEPELVGSAAHYRDVLPGVDLVAQAGPTGFSTFVVVESREAAMNPAVRDLTLDVRAEGVNVVDTTSGGLEAKDGNETVFTAAQPLMWDSEGVTDRVERSFTPEEKAVDAALTPPVAAEPVEMAMQASNTEISLDVSAQVLDDPNTVYPVILDPGITTAGIEYGGWTMLWSNGTTMYNHPTEMARVGYDGWSGSPKKSRSFFHMDVPLNALQGTMIASATFTHRQIHSPQNTCGVNYGPAIQIHRTERFTASSSWSNQPAVISSQSENAFGHGNEAYCPGFDRQSFNVLSGVKEAVAEGKDLTLRMKSGDETDRNGWRKYDNTQLGYPELSIIYYHYPPKPSAVGPTPSATDNGLWTNTTTPQVSAENVSDPNGGDAHGVFQIFNGSGAKIWEAVSGPAAGGTASAQVPSGKLVNGQSYTLRAYSAADAGGVYKSAGYVETAFQVDTALPAVPVAATPAESTEVRATMPVLAGSAVVRAGRQYTSQFELTDLTGQPVTDPPLEGPAVAMSGSLERQVPPGLLEEGRAYRWRLGVSDGINPTSWSPYQTFVFLTGAISQQGTANPASSCLTGPNRPLLASLTPILRAATSDVNAFDSVTDARIQAEIWSASGDEPLAHGFSPLAPADTVIGWSVPAGVLTDGGTYKWRVRGDDGSQASPYWSDWCEFSVDLSIAEAYEAVQSFMAAANEHLVSASPTPTESQIRATAAGLTKFDEVAAAMDQRRSDANSAGKVYNAVSTLLQANIAPSARSSEAMTITVGQTGTAESSVNGSPHSEALWGDWTFNLIRVSGVWMVDDAVLGLDLDGDGLEAPYEYETEILAAEASPADPDGVVDGVDPGYQIGDEVTIQSVASGYRLRGTNRRTSFVYVADPWLATLRRCENGDCVTIGKVKMELKQTVQGGSSNFWRFDVTARHRYGPVHVAQVGVLCARNIKGTEDQYCDTYGGGADSYEIAYVTPPEGTTSSPSHEALYFNFGSHVGYKHYPMVRLSNYWPTYGVTNKGDDGKPGLKYRMWDTKRYSANDVRLESATGTGY
jgi:hypothetical protein